MLVVVTLAPTAFHLMVTLYRAVLGSSGSGAIRFAQDAGVALPKCAGSFASVILPERPDAVFVPSVTEPVHVSVFGLLLTVTGPFSANAESGSARTARLGSVEWSALIQLSLSEGLSFAAVGSSVQLMLLPGPAVIVIGPALAMPPPSASPPRATAPAAPAIAILRIISVLSHCPTSLCGMGATDTRAHHTARRNTAMRSVSRSFPPSGTVTGTCGSVHDFMTTSSPSVTVPRYLRYTWLCNHFPCSAFAQYRRTAHHTCDGS